MIRQRYVFPVNYLIGTGRYYSLQDKWQTSLYIWTRVGEELYEDTKFQIDYDVAQKHFNGLITDEEFVNAVFEPQEQINEIQTQLLGTTFMLVSGGPAQAHVGTGSGGLSSDLPWGEQKNRKGNRKR